MQDLTRCEAGEEEVEVDEAGIGGKALQQTVGARGGERPPERKHARETLDRP
jgi:hypothetical protein